MFYNFFKTSLSAIHSTNILHNKPYITSNIKQVKQLHKDNMTIKNCTFIYVKDEMVIID